LVCTPKIANLRAGQLKRDTVSLSSDCFAIVDPANTHQVLLLDPTTGQSAMEPVQHSLEVMFCSLDSKGSIATRMLVFIDRNRDLFIKQLYGNQIYKLCTMVESAMWNEDVNILGAISDGKFLVWYSPEARTFDPDLMNLTQTTTDISTFGKMPRFLSFEGSSASIRREDGALLGASILTYPGVLKRYASALQWDRCSKLCRIVEDQVLWAVMAVCALQGQELDHAEVALAAINQVEKVQYVQMIKAIPSAEGRSAEMMLYRRQPKRAEQILLQANLVYRCIQMHLRLFNWKRALELALEHKIHVDTVLGYRQNYLGSVNQTETDPTFRRVSADFPVDWYAIRAKQQQELEKESKRNSPYTSDLGLSEETLTQMIS